MVKYEVSVCAGIMENAENGFIFYEGGETRLYSGKSHDAAVLVYDKAVAALPTVCEVEILENEDTARHAARAVVACIDDNGRVSWELEHYFNIDTYEYVDRENIINR